MHREHIQDPQKNATGNSNDIYGHATLACGKCRDRIFFAEKLNPEKLGHSPLMAAIADAIIGHDYGVRDPRGGRLTGISITSDGFVVASTTSHESGAFVGTTGDLSRNLSRLVNDTCLTPQERQEFTDLCQSNIADWRVQ